MDLVHCLALTCYLLCFICITAANPTTNSLEPRSCSDPVNTEVCFETSVPYKVVAQEAESAVLRCVIRNMNKEVVTWMRNDNRDIPMTIGKVVFTPDPRVTLDTSIPTEWNLVIRRAEVKDSGEYLCQVNGRMGLMAQAYSLVVEESQMPSRPSASPVGKAEQSGDKRFLNDDQNARSRGKSASVSIVGEDTIFENTRYFPLTCTARFGTRDAKLSPQVAMEWYHQGMRQLINASSMDISMSWADSDRAISVLTIYRVQMRHSGEWVCLKRSADAGSAGVMETATHTLTVLARDSPAAAGSDSRSEPVLASASFGIQADRSSAAKATAAAVPPTLLLAAVSIALNACSGRAIQSH